MFSHQLKAIKPSCLHMLLWGNKLTIAQLPELQAWVQQLVIAIIAAIFRMSLALHPLLCFSPITQEQELSWSASTQSPPTLLVLIFYLMWWGPTRMLPSHRSFYPNILYFSPAVHVSLCSCLNEIALHLPWWCPRSVLLTSLCHMCSMDVLFLVELLNPICFSLWERKYYICHQQAISYVS